MKHLLQTLYNIFSQVPGDRIHKVIIVIITTFKFNNTLYNQFHYHKNIKNNVQVNHEKYEIPIMPLSKFIYVYTRLNAQFNVSSVVTLFAGDHFTSTHTMITNFGCQWPTTALYNGRHQLPITVFFHNTAHLYIIINSMVEPFPYTNAT